MTSDTTALSDGTYFTSASTTYTNENPWKAFNKNNGSPGWTTSTMSYNNTTTGLYKNTTYFTSFYKIGAISGTSVYGEWLQIRMPSPTVIVSYSMAYNAGRQPKIYTITGSNDGTMWYEIDSQTSVQRGTVTTQDTPQSRNAYTYFRVTVNSIEGNTAYGFCSIIELYFNGYRSGSPINSCTNCPSGTYSTGGAFLCTTCPAGKYSDGGAASCTSCNAGTYSAAGAASCTKCPIGEYLTTGGTSVLSCRYCLAGRYSDFEGAASCSNVCSAGTYSLAGAGSCTSCNAGTYSNTIGATSSSTCTPCSAGTYSSAIGSSSCTSCPAGKYSAGGAASCTSCNAGTYSAAGATSCTSCPFGYSSAAGSSSCVQCPVGTYYQVGTTSCTPCSAGTYSNTIGATSSSTCTPCSAGTYSIAIGSSSCTSCPAGSYSNKTGGVNCTACLRGTYSPTVGATSNTTCLTCPTGTYSNFASGQASCTDCRWGTYSNVTGATSSSTCQTCSTGTYSGLRASSCTPCSLGKYSSAGSSTCDMGCNPGQYGILGTSACTGCPVGTYSFDYGAVGSCTPCAAGSYSGTTGSSSCMGCDPGYYQDKTGSSSCIICPIGTYGDGFSGDGATSCTPCRTNSYSDTPGSSSCTFCPDGTYNNTYGSTSASDCKPCPPGSFYNGNGCFLCYAGSYNPKSGSNSYDDCKKCSLGQYSNEGAASCTTCPIGTFNDGSWGNFSYCTTCPGGKITSTTGSTSLSQCNICPIGSYLVPEVYSISSEECVLCPGGMTTTITGATSPNQCVCRAGRYYDTTLGYCTPCPIGTVNPNVGGTSITACVPCLSTRAKYAQQPGGLICTAIPTGTVLGTFCPNGTTPDITSGPFPFLPDSCTPCLQGTYGLNGWCFDCPGGTYGSKTGETSPGCTVCPEGRTSLPGSTACLLSCPSGSISTLDNLSDGIQVRLCKQCQPGTYHYQFNSKKCISCPAGSYNPNTGSYSPNSPDGIGVCATCDIGLYSTEGSPLCTVCPAGTYNASPPINGPRFHTSCQKCRVGYYSDPGKPACTGCPAGSSTSVEGAPSCTPCLPGTYKSWIGGSCSSCAAGSYSDPGASSCTYCPAGTASSVIGGTSPSVCQTCPVGTWSFRGYSSCTNCSAGWYSPIIGATTYDVCLRCPVGTTSFEAASQCISPCQPGNYIDNVSKVCELCPLGTYSTSGGFITSCTSCPAGTYASSRGSTACILCPINTYFTGTNGTSVSACAPCGDGLYSQVGSTSYSNCRPIQAVTDCNSSQFYNFDTKQCEFKDLALSCVGKSTDDCISSTYTGTNAAKVSLTDYIYGTAPMTFVDVKVLPQGLQDTLSTCEGDCKFVAADFITQTFEKKSNIPYTIDTMQTTAEDKALIVREGSNAPPEFVSPPGFEFDDNAIKGSAMTISGFFAQTPDSCAIKCRENAACDGFNLNMSMPQTTCEFFQTVDSNVYVDSVLSFRKESIPTTPSSTTYYPGTNLGNQGSLCADAVACNSNLQRVIDDTSIASFTTSDLQACDYCPIRKFDRTNYIVTDELNISKSDITNIFFQTGGVVSHTQITDGEFYVLTPYIPSTTAWTKNALFRKETTSDRYKIISGGVLTTVGARSLVPFVPVSKKLKFEYTRVPEIRYSKDTQGNYPRDAYYNNSFTYKVKPGKFTIIPCDYVNDGFVFQNEEGQFISLKNNTTETVWSPKKYSEDYNSCIFFIKPSSIAALMTQYPPSGDYFSSGRLVQYNTTTNELYPAQFIDPSYFTDSVTSSRRSYIYYSSPLMYTTVQFPAPVYYSELATVDPGIVTGH